MVKMNMRKIKDTTEQLKDENNSIEKRHRSIICCNCSKSSNTQTSYRLGLLPKLSRKSTLQYVFGLDPKTKRL